jgi:hypothetical protein
MTNDKHARVVELESIQECNERNGDAMLFPAAGSMLCSACELHLESLICYMLIIAIHLS